MNPNILRALVIILTALAIAFWDRAHAASLPIPADPVCQVIHAQLEAQTQKQLRLIADSKNSPATDWQVIDQYLTYGRRVIDQLTREQAQKGCVL